MLGKLVLLFTILPLVDLYLLIKLGGRIGGPAALALVLLTGVLGAALARAEGLRVLRSFQQAIAAGRTPADGVVSGLLVLAGGALLITPGVITDVLGLLLLVPFTRRAVARLVIARVQRAIARGAIHVVHAPSDAWPFAHGGGAPPPWVRPSDVIDTEGEVVDSAERAAGGEDRPLRPELNPPRGGSS